MKKIEKEILKKYMNKKFPKAFYLKGNEEIVFLDSIIAGLCSRLLGHSSIKNIKNINIRIPLLDDEINSIIEKNIEAEGVLEFQMLLFETIKIIEKYL